MGVIIGIIKYCQINKWKIKVWSLFSPSKLVLPVIS